MKINTKIFTLIAGLALVLTGCQDDDFGKKYEPAKVGDIINFGGESGYADEGRTQYGEKGNGTTPIKWYNGDQVRIYCAQATGGTNNYSDYAVTEVGSNVSTRLTPVNSNSSLQWGDAGNHHFYGVYPTPGQLSSTTDSESSLASTTLSLVGNTVKGYLPTNQAPMSNQNYVVATDGNYIIHPAMRYAYMVAYNTHSLQSANSSSSVSLLFKPIVTAVEITLQNNSFNKVGDNEPENFAINNIKAFSITSDKVICGNFTTTIDKKTTEIDAFTTTVNSTETSYKTVFIPANISSLEYGKTVTFTAFMILADGDDLSQLTINIHTESGVKSGTLKRKNNGIIVRAEKKNFITNIPLNLGKVVETRNALNWVSHVPNTDESGNPILLKTLSIPGAGGATSKYIYDNVEGGETYAQQTLSITELWNQGIRCFELAVDRPSSSSISLANQQVICYGRTTNTTIKDAVDEITALLDENPQEFAMVIITYEQLGGWNGSNNISRSPNDFMKSLNTFWNGYSKYTALYDPVETTMEDARGKLFCIARPSSAYHDDGPSYKGGSYISASSVSYGGIDDLKVSDIHGDILVVNGWGPLKDKWEARGYTPNVFHRGRHRDSDDVLGFNSFKNYPGRPFDTGSYNYDGNGGFTNWDLDVDNYKTTTENGESANFYYSTQAGSTTVSENSAWIQEWARVSPSDFAPFGLPSNPTEGTRYKIYYWRPSISEKEQRIKECLTYALNASSSNSSLTKGQKLYINSLCGYFIDKTIEMSYLPNTHTDRSCGRDIFGHWEEKELTGNNTYAGMEGNIGDYAKYINNYFYNLLISSEFKTLLNGNNGTGIILMDRVSNDPIGNPAGYYIPQIIWSNNKENVTDGSGNGGGTTPGEGGDDVEQVNIIWQ